MGRIFGLKNYKETMSIKDYLTTSMDTDLFFEGVANGAKERQDMEAAYLKELEDKKKAKESSKSPMNAAMNAISK